MFDGDLPIAFFATALIVSVIALRIAWWDWRTLKIEDAGLLALGIAGLAWRLSVAPLHDSVVLELAMAGLDATLCGGSLFVLREVYYRRKGHDGIGFGDVKLAAAGGVLAGTTGFAWALMGASLTAMAFVLATGRLTSNPATLKIPFGTFLAPACCLAWAWGAWPR